MNVKNRELDILHCRKTSDGIIVKPIVNGKKVSYVD
jgi:hypothetical protein